MQSRSLSMGFATALLDTVQYIILNSLENMFILYMWY